MEIEDRKKLVKKVAIIVLPVLLGGAVFFKFFYNKNDSQTESSDTISTSVLDVPDAKRVSRDASSKWDSYGIEDSLANHKKTQDHISANLNIDDFLATEPNKEVSKEKESQLPEPSTGTINPIIMDEELPVKRTEVKKPVTLSEAKKSVKSSPNKIGFSQDQKREIFGPSPEEKEAKNQKEEKEVPEERKGFYSSTSHSETGSKLQDDEFIKCVIHNDQSIKNGSTIRLRITQDAIINGVQVPRNTYLSGTSSFSSERVMIRVTGIKLSDRILKTNLTAYEEDGIEGVYIPGGINQKLANEGAQDGVSGAGAQINIPIIGGSISTGARKKIADPTVKITSNYRLLLKDETTF